MKRFLIFFLFTALLLASPVLAADAYIYDDAGLLTEDERMALESSCALVEQTHQVGVYVVTVENYLIYGSSPYEAATNLYLQLDLGAQSSDMSDGVLLMLSMAARDYSLVCHGYLGNEVFDEYGREFLEEEFLPRLGDNRWAEGFAAYVDGCNILLNAYNMDMQDYYGEDYESYYSPGVRDVWDRLLYAVDYWIYVLPGSFLVALIICLLMMRSMRTAREATRAGEYIPGGGVQLRVKEDRYTHTTTQVIHHERSDSGGGSSGGGGGGFSGSSGKF